MVNAVNALERHDALMRVYATTTTTRGNNRSTVAASTVKATSEVTQLDLDVLRAHHQFLRDDDTDATHGDTNWQVRMSVRYYQRLFREYALADLSRYREGKIGLRWRTETEVVNGKGQFVCGNKRCDARTGLRSYELLFAYTEQRAMKRCLVKVRVCECCAAKLFYRKLAQLAAQEEREQAEAGSHGSRRQKNERRHRDRDNSSNSSRSKSTERLMHAESDTPRRKRRRREDNADDSDTDTGIRNESAPTGQNIHALCAAINDRERAADVSNAALFYEDRRGRADAFSDLLV